MIDSALMYASKGWPVFPCKAKGKAPLTPHGFKDASLNEKQIKRWWSDVPDANIAIVTGKVSGIVVLDVDVHGDQNGGKVLDGLTAKFGDLPTTPHVFTGGGGEHYYFRYPAGAEIPSKPLVPGVDLKSNGGYVIAPVSVHPSGQAYQWSPFAGPDDVELAELPEWIVRLATGEGVKQAVEKVPDVIPAGERNVMLTSVAGSLRRRGMAEEEIFAALQVINVKRCEPPLEDRELRAIARSVARYKPAEVKDELATTDLGNALRFLALHGDKARYCPPWNRWLIWDGKRWRVDESLEVYRLAFEVVKSIHQEAANAEDSEDRKRLGKWALASESGGHIEKMLKLAPALLTVMPQELDANPWLVNVENGTFDVSTGEMRGHEREDYITKLMPVAYQTDLKDAEAFPLWWQFLQEIFAGDGNLIQWLQAAVGYSFTGSTREEVMFILHGMGANGKTTFLETLRAIAGDYALTTPSETLTQNWNASDKIPNDIARMKGARFITASEAERGKFLAEALVKKLTGSDTLVARFMRAEFFEFRPTGKIWLATNHKPTIRGNDNAIWRRLFLVPFTVTIPLEKQDKELAAKLWKEREGILAWALHGARQWYKYGLGKGVSAVRAATDLYKSDMDVLGAFLTERCELKPGSTTSIKDLYAAYKRWAEDNGERSMSKRMLGILLKERGFRQTPNHHGAREWLGIAIE